MIETLILLNFRPLQASGNPVSDQGLSFRIHQDRWAGVFGHYGH